jgi:hypothetical protein
VIALHHAAIVSWPDDKKGTNPRQRVDLHELVEGAGAETPRSFRPATIRRGGGEFDQTIEH